MAQPIKTTEDTLQTDVLENSHFKFLLPSLAAQLPSMARLASSGFAFATTSYAV